MTIVAANGEELAHHWTTNELGKYFNDRDRRKKPRMI